MRQVKVGSEDITTYVMLVDEVDGSPKTGIGNTAVTCQYTLNQSTAATQSTGQFLLHPGSSHVDYGFVQVDATNSPGLYRVDWPNAAWFTGDQVSLAVTGSGFHPAIETVQLVAADASDLGYVKYLCDEIFIDTGTTLPATLATIDGEVGDILEDTGTTIPATLVTMDSDIGLILEDTGTTIPARLPSALDGGYIKSKPMAIHDTVAAKLGTLAIGTVNVVTSNTSFTVTGGFSSLDNVYNGRTIVIEDANNSLQRQLGVVKDYTGYEKIVELEIDPGVFTISSTDIVYMLATPHVTAIADAVWDEDLDPAHITAGTAGKAVIDIEVDTAEIGTAGDGLTVLAQAAALTTVDYEVGAMQLNVTAILDDTAEIGDAGIGLTNLGGMSTAMEDAIADAVWDEDLDPAHITAGTAGKAVIDIEVDTAEIGTAGVGLTAVANQVWSSSVHPGSTGTGLKLYDISVDTAEIGTAGDGLTDLGGMSDGMKAEITAQAWDATASSYTAAGSMGKIMNNMEAEHDDNTLMLQATIAAYSSNTEFIVDSGSTVNDTYLGCTIIIRDASDASVKAVGVISDYLGASKTITLSYDPNPLFTFAIGDSVNIIAVPNKVSPATQTQLVASTWSENSVGYPLPGTFGNILRHLGDDLNSLLLSTTIATYTSQTVIHLTAGSSLNDAYVGSTIIITDHNDGEKAVGIVSDYLGVTKTVTLQYNPANTWTFEADDIVNIIAAPSQLHSSIPTTIAQSVWTSSVNAGSTGTGLKLYDIKEDTTSLLTDTATLKSRTPIHPVKNVALANFPFLMVSDVDHVSPVADLSSITAERAIDNGSFSAIASAVSVIGNGMYRVDLSASDMNGDTITLRFSATSADDRLIIVLTQPKE